MPSLEGSVRVDTCTHMFVSACACTCAYHAHTRTHAVEMSPPLSLMWPVLSTGPQAKRGGQASLVRSVASGTSVQDQRPQVRPTLSCRLGTIVARFLLTTSHQCQVWVRSDPRPSGQAGREREGGRRVSR